MKFFEVIKRHRRLLLGVIDFFVVFMSSLITIPLVNGTMLFVGDYIDGLIHISVYSLVYVFIMYLFRIYRYPIGR